MNKSAFVLVHGAFRGGWIWQKVQRILQSKNFETFAPSLTGAGEKVHLLSAEITLETWIWDIVNLLKYKDLTDVVLVGHSQGGIVIQAVAEEVSEKVSKMIFIDAPVLRDGECALDILPQEIREKFGKIKKNALIQPTLITADEYFSDKETAWFNERLTAVPTNPSMQKIKVQKSAKIHQKYAFCTQTPPFFPSSFTRQRFDREGIKYELIDAPHDCIWSHAETIAEICLKV